jgi:predicted nucleic acid-binding protein
VAETYVAIRRAAGHGPAMHFLHALRQSVRLTIVYASAPLETAAVALLDRHQDQTFSYVDAVSFALMRERGMSDAFAFDRHFATAGFVLLAE